MNDNESAGYGCEHTVFFGAFFTASLGDGFSIEQLTAFNSMNLKVIKIDGKVFLS